MDVVGELLALGRRDPAEKRVLGWRRVPPPPELHGLSDPLVLC